MKTWKIFGLMALLLAGFSACSDDSTKEPGDDDGQGGGAAATDTLMLRAMIRQNASDVPWRKGADSISVLVDTANWLFVTGTGGDTASFYGPGAKADVYYGFYPYQEEARLESTAEGMRLYAELPAEQKAVEGGWDYRLNVAAGKTSDGQTLQFRLLCGYLRFNLQDCAAKVSAIRLSGNHREPLAGTLTIDMENRTIVTASEDVIMLTPADGGTFDKNVNYYFLVAPGTLNGVTFDFYDESGTPHQSVAVNTLEVLQGKVLDLNKSISYFVPDDMAWGVRYDKNDAYRFWDVLQHVDPERATVLGTITTVSDEGYAMFQKLTNEWCADAKTDEEKVDIIFARVREGGSEGISYAETGTDQSAEGVWKNKKGNCQGFSNLFKVLCHTQGIPCMGANGMVYDWRGGLGHAWTFAYYADAWHLVDALWRQMFLASDLEVYGKSYTSGMDGSWQTYLSDLVLAEDSDFEYGYNHGLNIFNVKAGAGEKAVIPNTCSVLGNVEVASFVPQGPLPAGVKEITIGANVSYLGEEETNLSSGCAALRDFAPNVEWFDVAEGNRTYTSYEGIIYRGGHDAPLHIPGAMQDVVLRPVNSAGKDFILGNESIRTIRFAEGTASVSAGAVSNCPNLQKVYVPEDTNVASGAFESNVEIVRY